MSARPYMGDTEKAVPTARLVRLKVRYQPLDGSWKSGDPAADQADQVVAEGGVFGVSALGGLERIEPGTSGYNEAGRLLSRSTRPALNLLLLLRASV
jgi:hypothetical protein